ncbi:glycosyltransferase family 39 protein [Nocardioides sp. CGMCC 1.13656]|uniref:ArnT family glycosyltransferase n=1 Tax=Nocardioides TaxID=1839 RepID=UPI0012FBE66A|nr:glycosyltransferase family 39 protein [Nocardioides sp. CGMCC 1.13656]MBA2954904.1 glycosyltransferase family 39 protein [Nocardioides sp. CGMCC 1.13656]
MTRPPYAVREVAVVVAVLELGLVLLAPYYGPHRDELYFVAAGQHLAWGYPDQPALTPLLARLADLVAPGNLVVLRIPSTLASVGVVLLSAQAARLLGGRRASQVATAVVVGFSVLVPGLGHLLSTATFDMLLWTAVLVVVMQALLDDRPRLWLLAGALAGLGLNNKHAMVFCLLGVLVGVAAVEETRPVLRTRWPWLGGLIALAMWIPNLVWQALHGWPVFALAADIAREYGGVGGRLGLVLEVLVMFSPLIAAVWILGLVRLMQRPDWVLVRPVAVAFLVVLGVFVITGGKGYYLAGLVPVLIAAGLTSLVHKPSGRRRLEQATTRGLAITSAVLVASAAVAYPAVLPLLPASTYAGSVWADLDGGQLDTIGWPEYAGQVSAVIEQLTEPERASVVIFTGNYGEAGAMEWYGVGRPVYSGHNGYQEWGPPPEDATPVIVVFPTNPSKWFRACEDRLKLNNEADAPNEEVGVGIWVCAGPRGSWADAWDELSHYSA